MQHFLVHIAMIGAPDETALKEHKQFLDELTREGILRLAGILPDQAGKGIAIISAPTLEAATLAYGEAPLSKRGLIEWTVEALTPTYGTFHAAMS